MESATIKYQSIVVENLVPMLAAKQVADLVTFSRGLLAFWLAWLGWSQGAKALVLAVCIMLAAWTGDAADGMIARRSRNYYHTWLGDHDLEVDMIVSGGLLVYLIGAGYIKLQVVIFFLLAWVLIFLKWGFHRSLGMLFQAPIYGWFILVALREPPSAGWWIVAWIILVVALTWPRFPNEVVPGFLKGMRRIVDESQHSIEKNES